MESVKFQPSFGFAQTGILPINDDETFRLMDYGNLIRQTIPLSRR